jgi:hypothetical protein
VRNGNVFVFNVGTLLKKERNNEPYETLLNSYSAAPNQVKRIMANNALRQVWGDRRYLHIADLFLETDFVIAGILAGRELEHSVRKACKKIGISISWINPHNGHKEQLPFIKLLNKLEKKRKISSAQKDKICNWWHIRCDLAHKDTPSYTKEQVHEMVQNIIQFLQLRLL